MVNLLISIILSGFAVTFAIELIALITSWFFQKPMIYAVLSLPFSFLAMFVMYKVTREMFVSVPATAFVTLVLNKYLNAASMTSTRLKRL